MHCETVKNACVEEQNHTCDHAHFDAAAISDKHRLEQKIGWSHVNHGWAVAMLGDSEAGLSEIETGMAQFQKTGRNTWTPFHLVMRSEVSLRAGRFDPVLRWTDEAFAIMADTGEHQFLAPGHVVEGDALLGLERASDSEDVYRQAIEIAGSQSAKSWKLRAASRLARLWKLQGKTTEARDFLAPVYGWFTEGFDTPDPKEARALLNELG